MEIFQVVPVLTVSDVERSMHWYEEHLGFVGDPFPERSPYRFAILRHERLRGRNKGGESAEIMLRLGEPVGGSCESRVGSRGRYEWDVYLRLRGAGFKECYQRFQRLGLILRECELMTYGLEEFEVSDPDGYSLCLSRNPQESRFLG